MDPLLDFHRKVLNLLENSSDGNIAQAFLSFCQEFEETYVMHCNQISPALEVATRYSSDPRMLSFLEVRIRLDS